MRCLTPGRQSSPHCASDYFAGGPVDMKAGQVQRLTPRARRGAGRHPTPASGGTIRPAGIRAGAPGDPITLGVAAGHGHRHCLPLPPGKPEYPGHRLMSAGSDC
ncbi:MAG: hypothetical protein MZV70_39590 [Desulfobacterales bacterium]|nr:hypothetical protein [Desulfobacterales bacterium]